MRVLATCAALVLAGSLAQAQSIPAGCDCYVTEPPPAGDTQVRIPALPAGFFGSVAGNPSDPRPSQAIPVQGLALPPAIITALCPNAVVYETVWVDQHGTPVAPDDRHRVGQSQVATVAAIDTIICRPNATPVPPPGGSAPIEIELRELSLVSVNPISVTYGGGAATRFWNVLITEQGVSPGGSMTIQTTGTLPNGVTGGMTMNSLPVQYQLRFEEINATLPANGLPGNLDFTNSSTGTWTFFTGPPIPAMTTWGLAILTLVLLGAGAFTIHKRKVAL